ncbi:uncharacterized protein KZ484_010607 isoform 1-T2 [Pholidichthys leucotaenia]
MDEAATMKEEQEEPEPPQMKEEQEELCISQEGEQLEADTFMVTLISGKNQQSEAEPKSEQLLSHSSARPEIQDEDGSRRVHSGSTKEEEKEEEEPKSKKRRLQTRSHSNGDDDSLTSDTLCQNETVAPQLHDCKEEEVLTVQQLCNHERNSSLDQEEQDAAKAKEEENLGAKQETDTFMVTPTDEVNDNSETKPNSEQLLSHNSPDTESQDQGTGKNVNSGSSKHEEPKKRLHRTRSDFNSVDNSIIPENQRDTVTDEKSVKYPVNDEDFNESQKKAHTVARTHVCNVCGNNFSNRGHLTLHQRIHIGEKPYSCETSGQSFNNLKIHRRVHRSQRPL